MRECYLFHAFIRVIALNKTEEVGRSTVDTTLCRGMECRQKGGL